MTGNKQELYRAVIEICTFKSKQQFVQAAEKSAVFLGIDTLLESIKALTAYNVQGLLPAKRLIANATSRVEKYIF